MRVAPLRSSCSLWYLRLPWWWPRAAFGRLLEPERAHCANCMSALDASTRTPARSSVQAPILMRAPAPTRRTQPSALLATLACIGESLSILISPQHVFSARSAQCQDGYYSSGPVCSPCEGDAAANAQIRAALVIMAMLFLLLSFFVSFASSAHLSGWCARANADRSELTGC